MNHLKARISNSGEKIVSLESGGSEGSELSISAQCNVTNLKLLPTVAICKITFRFVRAELT